MNPNAAQHQQQANIQEHQQEQQQQQQQQLQHQQQEQEQSSEVDENQSTNQTIESWQGESGDIEMVSGQEQGQGQGQDEKRKAGDVPWEECAKQSDVALQELKRPQAVVVPDVNYQTQQSQKNSGQQLHGVQVIDLQQGDQPWGANFPFIYRQALRMPPPEETPDIAFGIPVDPIFYPHQLTSYIHPDNNNNNTTTALHEENQKFQWQQNIQGQNTQQNVVSSGNNNNNNNSNTGQEEDAKENFDQNFNSGSDASGM